MTADSKLHEAEPLDAPTSSSFSQVQLTLEGHLTEAALAVALDKAERELHASKSLAVLVVDCLTMTGYDSAARSLFVAWNSRYKQKFLCVAVLTRNKLWHMVVSSMSLASGQKMKAFNEAADAEPWIQAQRSRQA